MRSDAVRQGCIVEDRSAPERGHVELTIIFPGTPLAVRDALRRTLGGLRALPMSVDEATTVELVLAEVLNNVVEHAYADRRDGTVKLHCLHAPEGLLCQVSDNGRAMTQDVAPAGLAPNPICPDDLHPEGGFGWFLIRSLTENLEYRRDTDRNRLSFRLPVALAPQMA